MLIPMRAGDEGLVVSWDLEELVAVLPRPNVELERVWASVLTVVRDSWPDWPIGCTRSTIGYATPCPSRPTDRDAGEEFIKAAPLPRR